MNLQRENNYYTIGRGEPTLGRFFTSFANLVVIVNFHSHELVVILQLVFVNDDVYLVDLNNTYRKFTGIDSEGLLVKHMLMPNTAGLEPDLICISRFNNSYINSTTDDCECK